MGLRGVFCNGRACVSLVVVIVAVWRCADV